MPPKKDGAHDKARYDAEVRLREQVDASASVSRAIFVPGNHDWGGDDIGHQAAFIAAEDARLSDEHKKVRLAFMPEKTDCAVKATDVGAMTLIALDTELLLRFHAGDRTQLSCADPYDEIAKIITASGDRKYFVVAHHPLASGGPHGGYYDLKNHIFPLTTLSPYGYLPAPIIGTLILSTRKSDQDIASDAYRKMIARLETAFAGKPPEFYAAGHEHSLQVLRAEGGRPLTLVSGHGSKGKGSAVKGRNYTVHASRRAGFMVVDFYSDNDAPGDIRLETHEVGAASPTCSMAFADLGST